MNALLHQPDRYVPCFTKDGAAHLTKDGTTTACGLPVSKKGGVVAGVACADCVTAHSLAQTK